MIEAAGWLHAPALRPQHTLLLLRVGERALDRAPDSLRAASSLIVCALFLLEITNESAYQAKKHENRTTVLKMR